MAGNGTQNGNVKAVYTIREDAKSDKSCWTKIGVAFVNRDDSINVQLDALPLDGKLHIREFSERPEQNGRNDRNQRDR
ncbi:MAG: hypothetical protein A2289_09660 [Deltaproteobacteria bacterium RIFOXYA12_FULL_58_15]|nr:MAG: hypothetical protein A2289_09660 [Deltaproteobacteria bacterium RIFOXYA12_FULL_58_15]